jgi:histone H3/H4
MANILSLASMEKLLKKYGAKRVSADAKTVLAEILEAKAKEIAETAARNASHFGRKTVKSEDISSN